MSDKWTIKRGTSESGEKYVELLRDGVSCILMPPGCLQMGWEGGALQEFLGILNTHGKLLEAMERIKAQSEDSLSVAQATDAIVMATGEAEARSKLMVTFPAEPSSEPGDSDE